MSLEQLLGTMKEEMENAEMEAMKFTTGNKSAGTRVRKGMQALKVWAQDVRKEVQARKNAS